jgi:hypothetical protein
MSTQFITSTASHYNNPAARRAAIKAARQVYGLPENIRKETLGLSATETQAKPEQANRIPEHIKVLRDLCPAAREDTLIEVLRDSFPTATDAELKQAMAKTKAHPGAGLNLNG